MTYIYLLKYKKDTFSPISLYPKTENYSIICKNEKEIKKEIERIYHKNNYIYPNKLDIETIYLSENEVKKIKELYENENQ